MKKIWTQVKYHLKKEKGSFLSFGIIIFFTAFMLNLSLVLINQVDRAYDEKFDMLHTANINLLIPKIQDVEDLEAALEKIQGVAQIECHEAVFCEAVVKEFRGVDFSMNTIFYNREELRKLNQVEIKKESSVASDQSIALPLYVSGFGEFETGEEIIYEIDGRAYTFLISGVLEEMQYGNYGKGLMGAYLSEEAYERFVQEQDENVVMEYSLLTKKDSDLDQIKKEIGSLLNDKGIMMLSVSDSLSTKETRTMVCDLLILILAAFSMVILLVSVFLCKFRISNSIEEEIVSMGVLKALGYTGNMIIGSSILPYIMVAGIAAGAGVCASYIVLPVLSNVLTLQSGFSFVLCFDGKGLITTELLLVCVVFLFTYMAAKKIRKIQPIYAMRGESGTKHVKRNYIPLETTKGKTSALLILKQMAACGKQNVLLFFVSFVLAILVAFASTLFYNVVIKPDNFMTTLSEELSDVVVAVKKCDLNFLAERMQNDSRVEKVLEYFSTNVEIDEKTVTAFVGEDFKQVSNDLCYLGENPKTDKEIALGSIFEDTYQTGDTILLKNNDKVCEYTVTGFVQSVNYQGNICEMTVEGYTALYGEADVTSLYVYLENEVDAEAFTKEYSDKYPTVITNIVNSQKMAETSREMFSEIAVIVISAVFILTMLIVFFILYIVIKSLLVQRKQELGIYKAIGYSNWQLMLQLAGSFLPVSVGAVLLSSTLALVYMPYINQIIFRTVGAVKNNLEISFTYLMIFALVQIIINFVISMVLSMPVKKISAYSLLKE